jgi:hypothetical protein
MNTPRPCGFDESAMKRVHQAVGRLDLIGQLVAGTGGD